MQGTYIDHQNIKRVLRNWKLEASEHQIDTLYDYINGVVVIYTTRPGQLVGQGGKLLEKYKQELMMSCDNVVNVLLFEVENVW